SSKVIKNSFKNKLELDYTIAKSDFYVNLLPYSLDFFPIVVEFIMLIQGHFSLISFVTIQYSNSCILNS
ncbi:hypothetical protein CEE82_12030, partial [Lactobacillus crispatus]